MTTATTQQKNTGLATLHAELKDDLSLTNKYLKDCLNTDTALIQTISERLIHAGGKRIRPTLTLLMAKLFNYQGTQHAQLAAIIELLHTATLLHDDVVDQSNQRRGQTTAHTLWGNKAAILVGDFLYARCFDLITGINAMPIMRTFATASNALTRGEIDQLVATNDQKTTIPDYLRIIQNKTAHLFVAAALSAAILSGAGDAAEQAAEQFGMAFGMAYQLIDDALDYSAQNPHMDKKTGNDLAEGKLTLPVLYALKQVDAATQQTLWNAIQNQDPSMDAHHFATVVSILEQTGALDYTRRQAQQYTQTALLAIGPWAHQPAYARLKTLLTHNIERLH